MPGDGIGNDVMEATKLVLDKLNFDAEIGNIVPCAWIAKLLASPQRSMTMIYVDIKPLLLLLGGGGVDMSHVQCQSVDWSVGRLVGRSVGRSVCWSVGQSVGRSVSR